MRNTIKNILLISFVFLITGCSYKVEYDKQYIETDVKTDLKKVSTDNIVLKNQKSLVINKHPNSFRAKASTIELNMSSINDNVLKEFFKQYFEDSNIKFGEDKTNLFVESNFYDYEYAYGAFGDGNDVRIFVDIKVYYKNRMILDKKYNIEKGISAITFGNATIIPLLTENFQEALLLLYEEQFKPDLLEALKKEIK